jgi:hypothetical protein
LSLEPFRPRGSLAEEQKKELSENQMKVYCSENEAGRSQESLVIVETVTGTLYLRAGCDGKKARGEGLGMALIPGFPLFFLALFAYVRESLALVSIPHSPVTFRLRFQFQEPL